MKEMKRLLALVLCAVMLIGMLPVSASAESDDALTGALAEAKTYIDSITVNNSSNDPETVVKNFKTHFTWDNEKRENSKSYLFDWSYYNGVVFEGLEYLYEVSRDETYKDYVVEYMSSLIAEDGSWALCTNDSTKERAGYVDYHGADCYKTASLLLDAHEMTGDDRYLTMAATLYADLDTAADKYSLPNAGNNYHHTWASASSPNLWLDGLYMILPFRAEYAAYTGDTEELDLIVDRMQWVSDNMYNSAKGLFYHAADSASSNSGTHWLRSIGWYAAAIVDVMDSMEGENLEAMKAQLVKLVDGMKAVQNSSNGMWLNNLNASESSSNPYETSGTALTCYAVMKAVNNGWLDESYADMAILAFEGICSEKLSDDTLTDICFKGAPGSSNSTFYDNEGKGVGPFIMLYAEVLEYVNTEDVPETTAPAETEPEIVVKTDEETGVSVEAEGITGLEVVAVATEEIAEAVAEVLTGTLVAYDITVADFVEGSTAAVTVNIPEGVAADKFGVYYVPTEGEPELMEGEAAENGETYTFYTDHFSTYVGGEVAVAAETGTNSGTGNLVGGIVYTLDTNGVTANKNYLIVNTSNNGTGYALTNNNGSAGSTTVSISNSTITVEDDTNIAWVFSGSTSGTVGNNGRYVYPNQNSLSLNTSGTNMTISDQDDGAYRIYRYSNNYYYYLRYNNNSWTGSRTRQQNSVGSVYLYEYTSSSNGEAVTFTVTPASATLQPNGTVALDGTVTVGGAEVDLSDCTITWASSAEGVATVSDGTVTGVGDGDANITATLSAVNGTALQEDIVLTIPVTVQSKAIVSAVLDSYTGNVSRGSNQSADTGTKITVTYDDGTTEDITVTPSMISGTFDLTTEGTYKNLTVKYGTSTFTGYTLNVNPKAGNNYPEYPDAGAVDVNKYLADTVQFQNTGVANVELTTSGIPVQTGVDAVLTIDISNSMAWETTTKTDNFEQNKLTEVMTAIENFANILLAPNEDGTPTNNTITIVTFAGYDAEHWNGSGSYVDSVRTLVTKTSSLDVISEITSNTYFTGKPSDYQIQIAYIPENADQNNADNVTTDSGNNRGDTNYDYAFWQTEQAIIDGQLGGDEREIHVIFMTDGCASNFNDHYYRSNNVGYYYRPGTTTAYSYYAAGNGTAWTNWIQESIEENNGNIYAKNVYERVTGMYAVGFDMANGSFTGLSTWDSSVDWADKFNDIVSKLVGVDANGNGYIPVTAASDTETLNNFYESLAREIRYAATNAYFVDQMGDDFDLQLKSYVTKFTDTDGDDIVDSTGTVIALSPAPAITVSSYKVYTSKDVGKTINGTTVTTSMIGERYGTPTVLETVVFSADGAAAYSSADGYEPTTKTVGGETVTDHTGTTNILVDGVVCADTFWYNTTSETKTITLANGSTYDLPAETFYWNIGTINETEYVLNYMVYLEGAAEGKASEGTYETNESANLYYTNWLGNSAIKQTTSPKLTWGGAQVSYGFYLVDENGNPVTNQTTGATGSFYDAVKVTQATLYKAVNLNSAESVNDVKAIAAELLPDGYTLYDTGAAYTIRVDSGNTLGGWVIDTAKPVNSDGVQVYSTYVTDFNGAQASNVTNVTDDSYDYSRTTVWFAVKWIIGTVPDVVVIDYGLPVDITVMANDMFGENGKLHAVGKTNPIAADAELKYLTDSSDDFAEELDLSYGSIEIREGTGGTATSEGSKVRYTPASMEMPTYDKFAYEVEYTKTNTDNTTEIQYYYGDVTVIPATTIYYEDNFVELSSYTWNDTDNKWDEVQDGEEKWVWETVIDDPNPDGTQDEDRPDDYNLPYIDANNLYGYDSAYTSMSEYSMGSAMKAHVDYDNYATVNFSFWGTGFDVVSLTSNKTGIVLVTVYEHGTTTPATYTDENNAERNCTFIVDTYYGYARKAATDENGNVVIDENGNNVYEWVIVDDNDPNTLYQVPIIKIENLDYGHYDVLLEALYDTGFDHGQYDKDANGNGAYDFYLDAIRIYDPANDGAYDGADDTVIEDAYEADGEYLPKYYELRNWLISRDTFNSLGGTEIVEGIAFVGVTTDGTADGMGTTMSVEDYNNYGPNNELYLAPGQAVAFNLNAGYLTPDGYEVDTVQLELKSVGGTAYAKIWNTQNGSIDTATMRTIASATDLYYDITSMDNKTVVIKNVGDDDAAILSITNMKVTFKETENTEDSGLEGQSIQNPRTLKTMGDIAPVSTYAVNAVADETGSEETVTVNAPFTISIADVEAAIASMELKEEPEEPTEPAVTEPEESEPETTEPEVTEPEESEPETTEPEETEPEVTEPETTEPDPTEPEETEPEEDGNGSAIGRLIGWIIGLIGWIFG